MRGYSRSLWFGGITVLATFIVLLIVALLGAMGAGGTLPIFFVLMAATVAAAGYFSRSWWSLLTIPFAVFVAWFVSRIWLVITAQCDACFTGMVETLFLSWGLSAPFCASGTLVGVQRRRARRRRRRRTASANSSLDTSQWTTAPFQHATPQTGDAESRDAEPAASTIASRDLARQFTQLFDVQTPLLTDFLDETYIHHLGATTLDRQQVVHRIESIRRGFPDLRASIDHLVGDEVSAAARLTLHGTHAGTLDDLAPTGRAITFTVSLTWRLHGSVLTEGWEDADWHGLVSMLSDPDADGV